VTNAGEKAWAASGPDSVGLIWELRDEPGDLITSSPNATRLPALPAGRSVNVGLQIATPFSPGLYHVTIGLVDSSGRGLSALGAATATFDVKTHLPFLVNASVSVPTALHRGEASLVVIKYAALATAGVVDHKLALAWQAIDVRTSRTVAQGTTAIGVLKPGAEGYFYVPLVTPNIRGSYKLSYELREGDVAVSDTATTNVTIYAPRTYPDDEGGRTPGPITITPTGAPRTRAPFPSPSGVVPNLGLPSLPTPRGKPTPAR
jgi:hypothetical protein